MASPDDDEAPVDAEELMAGIHARIEALKTLKASLVKQTADALKSCGTTGGTDAAGREPQQTNGRRNSRGQQAPTPAQQAGAEMRAKQQEEKGDCSDSDGDSEGGDGDGAGTTRVAADFGPLLGAWRAMQASGQQHAAMHDAGLTTLPCDSPLPPHADRSPHATAAAASTPPDCRRSAVKPVIDPAALESYKRASAGGSKGRRANELLGAAARGGEVEATRLLVRLMPQEECLLESALEAEVNNSSLQGGISDIVPVPAPETPEPPAGDEQPSRLHHHQQQGGGSGDADQRAAALQALLTDALTRCRADDAAAAGAAASSLGGGVLPALPLPFAMLEAAGNDGSEEDEEAGAGLRDVELPSYLSGLFAAATATGAALVRSRQQTDEHAAGGRIGDGLHVVAREGAGADPISGGGAPMQQSPIKTPAVAAMAADDRGAALAELRELVGTEELMWLDLQEQEDTSDTDHPGETMARVIPSTLAEDASLLQQQVLAQQSQPAAVSTAYDLLAANGQGWSPVDDLTIMLTVPPSPETAPNPRRSEQAPTPPAGPKALPPPAPAPELLLRTTALVPCHKDDCCVASCPPLPPRAPGAAIITSEADAPQNVAEAGAAVAGVTPTACAAAEMAAEGSAPSATLQPAPLRLRPQLAARRVSRYRALADAAAATAAAAAEQGAAVCSDQGQQGHQQGPSAEFDQIEEIEDGALFDGTAADTGNKAAAGPLPLQRPAAIFGPPPLGAIVPQLGRRQQRQESGVGCSGGKDGTLRLHLEPTSQQQGTSGPQRQRLAESQVADEEGISSDSGGEGGAGGGHGGGCGNRSGRAPKATTGRPPVLLRRRHGPSCTGPSVPKNAIEEPRVLAHSSWGNNNDEVIISASDGSSDDDADDFAMLPPPRRSAPPVSSTPSTTVLMDSSDSKRIGAADNDCTVDRVDILVPDFEGAVCSHMQRLQHEATAGASHHGRGRDRNSRLGASSSAAVAAGRRPTWRPCARPEALLRPAHQGATGLLPEQLFPPESVALRFVQVLLGESAAGMVATAQQQREAELQQQQWQQQQRWQPLQLPQWQDGQQQWVSRQQQGQQGQQGQQQPWQCQQRQQSWGGTDHLPSDDEDLDWDALDQMEQQWEQRKAQQQQQQQKPPAVSTWQTAGPVSAGDLLRASKDRRQLPHCMQASAAPLALPPSSGFGGSVSRSRFEAAGSGACGWTAAADALCRSGAAFWEGAVSGNDGPGDNRSSQQDGNASGQDDEGAGDDLYSQLLCHPSAAEGALDQSEPAALSQRDCHQNASSTLPAVLSSVRAVAAAGAAAAPTGGIGRAPNNKRQRLVNTGRLGIAGSWELDQQPLATGGDDTLEIEMEEAEYEEAGDTEINVGAADQYRGSVAVVEQGETELLLRQRLEQWSVADAVPPAAADLNSSGVLDCLGDIGGLDDDDLQLSMEEPDHHLDDSFAPTAAAAAAAAEAGQVAVRDDSEHRNAALGTKRRRSPGNSPERGLTGNGDGCRAAVVDESHAAGTDDPTAGLDLIIPPRGKAAGAAGVGANAVAGMAVSALDRVLAQQLLQLGGGEDGEDWDEMMLEDATDAVCSSPREKQGGGDNGAGDGSGVSSEVLATEAAGSNQRRDKTAAAARAALREARRRREALCRRYIEEALQEGARRAAAATGGAGELEPLMVALAAELQGSRPAGVVVAGTAAMGTQLQQQRFGLHALLRAAALRAAAGSSAGAAGAGNQRGNGDSSSKSIVAAPQQVAPQRVFVALLNLITQNNAAGLVSAATASAPAGGGGRSVSGGSGTTRAWLPGASVRFESVGGGGLPGTAAVKSDRATTAGEESCFVVVTKR